jgi:preprotein translocase subunit SecE
MSWEIYKKSQGYYTRVGTVIGAGLLAALGCYALYSKLDGIIPGKTITPVVKAWIQAGVPAVLFGVLGWAIFKAVNMPKWADFMIATEGEMKKVSWSSKKEIVTSTKVVILTVIVMAILLTLVDVGFTWVFTKIGVLQVMGLVGL